jgi:hypothetical protein
MSASHEHQSSDRPASGLAPARLVQELSFLELAGCPVCDQPTEILRRDILESTSGPIEHVRIRCLVGHAFFMPTSLLRDL